MRATATILGFGLLCTSLPVAISLPGAAQAAPADKSASVKPEARIGSLAPDEARRAERSRRRAADKNAKAAARETDHTMLEGKSVAAPETPASTDRGPAAAAVMPAPDKKAAEQHNVKPARKTATQVPEAPEKAAPSKAAVAVPQHGDVDRGRYTERVARGHDRHDRRYAARRKANRERFASDGAYRVSPDEVIVEDEAPVALPPGAPPYPLRPRTREVYVVRELPAPPTAYEDYGPRPFYPGRGPGFMRGPVDDVE